MVVLFWGKEGRAQLLSFVFITVLKLVVRRGMYSKEIELFNRFTYRVFMVVTSVLTLLLLSPVIIPIPADAVGNRKDGFTALKNSS